MTSAINYTSIDENYPVAGQDNDSQGFRDNFLYLKNGLHTAKTEITDLQDNVLLSGILNGEGIVTNNLNGSSITNGSYSSFFSKARVITTSTPTPSTVETNIDVSLYELHAIKVQTTPITFVLTNWSQIENSFNKVRIHVHADNPASTITFDFATVDGTMVGTTSYTIAANNSKHNVFEAWSFDSGTTVYIRYIGEF